MVYMINSFEFLESDAHYSLNTKYKPRSRELEKTMPLIQIVSAKLQLVVAVCMKITYHFMYIDHEGKIISLILNKTAFKS